MRTRERCAVGTSLATDQFYTCPNDRIITPDISNPSAVTTATINRGARPRHAALLAVERREEGLRLYWRSAPTAGHRSG